MLQFTLCMYLHSTFPGSLRHPAIFSVTLLLVPIEEMRCSGGTGAPGPADARPPGALLPPDQNECIIANPAFVVYSSIVSFYVPFIVTLLVYIKIYIVLRRRRKRVNTKRSSRAFRANLKAPLKVPRSPLPGNVPTSPLLRGLSLLSEGLGHCSRMGPGWRSSEELGEGRFPRLDLSGAP